MNLRCTRGAQQEYTDTESGKSYFSVSQVLTVLDPYAFAYVDPYVMAAAQQRGTDLHVLFGLRLFAEIDLADRPTRPSGILGGFYDGIERFIKERKPRPIKVEQPSVCKDLPYAGTLDTECWLDGTDSILDLKTGPPRAVHAPQLHAYKRLEGHEKAKRLFSLYINREGQYRLIEHTHDHVDWSGFQAALTVLQWRRYRQ